jgi:hypothetical protein
MASGIGVQWTLGPELPFYSDEAWFILIGYGNNQNNRY